MFLEVKKKKCIAFLDLQIPKNKMKVLKSIVYETLSNLQCLEILCILLKILLALLASVVFYYKIAYISKIRFVN